MSDERAQDFGGAWTLIKTDTVEKYIHFFNKALSRQSLTRVYIDAFAGSGHFTYVPSQDRGDPQQSMMFGDPEPASKTHAGSAKRALLVEPPFHRLHFFDKREENVAALRALIAETGHRHATATCGDANALVRALCEQQGWRFSRGVIFLDPFGMTVDWETLKAVRATNALDVWYLFPLAGMTRNLPHDAAQLDDDKRAAVTRVLGTDGWFNDFYQPRPGLFGEGAPQRSINIDGIERYVHTRLSGIFPHVEKPKRLLGPNRAPLFSLFFAMSNDNEKAIKLALKVARWILERG